MHYLDILRYYCSPAAENLPDAERLTQLINLIHIILPVLESLNAQRQLMVDFDEAMKKLENL